MEELKVALNQVRADGSSIMLAIPPVLCKDKKLIEIIQNIIEKEEVFYIYNELFDYWQGIVAEDEYVKNSLNESNMVKQRLMSLLEKNISFIFCVDFEEDTEEYLLLFTKSKKL